jgi:hypothetical protein
MNGASAPWATSCREIPRSSAKRFARNGRRSALESPECLRKIPTLSYHPNQRKIGVSWEPRLAERMGYKRHLRENDLVAQCVAQPLRPQRKLRLRAEKRRKGWGLFCALSILTGCLFL